MNRMKHLSVTLVIGLLFSIFSCMNATKEEKDDTPSDSLTAHQKARVLRAKGASADEYMPLQLQAVQEVYNGTSTDDPVEVLSQMGYFYRRNGDYINAVKYMQEASDYIAQHPEYHNTHVEAELLGNLANLYAQLDMHQEAIAANSKAIELCGSQGRLLPDLYIMRAGMYASTGDFDSVMYYHNRAVLSGESLPEDSFYTSKANTVNAYRQMLAISCVEYHEQFPDSLDSALKTLEAIDTHNNGMETARFLLGYGYILKGDTKRGIPLMESAVKEFEQQQWGEGIHWAYRIMIKVYSDLKMSEKASRLYPLYNHLDDSIKSVKRTNAAIAADIRYNATRKQEHINQLNTQLSMARQRMILLWIIVVLSLIIISGITWYVVDRCKKNRRKRMHLNMRIAELISSQRQLSSRLNTLMDEINSGAIENAKGVLSPSLLKTDEAGKFRRTFETLYPNITTKLREIAPNLTQNDELLCMLVYLKQTPEEISKCLGITRMSVNSARYRVRSKLGLSKETDFDEYIQSL